MNTEAREVSAPESAVAPTHVLSDIGQQRLAALQAAEPLAPPADPAKVTDAEGGVADTTTGEYTPPARPDQEQPTGERPVRPETLEQIAPLAVSEKYHEVAEHYRAELGRIAEDTGIAPSELSVLYQFAGSAAAADYAKSEMDAVLDQGQQIGPSLRSNDETRQRLQTRFGDLAEAVIQAAAREFAALPESVREWIDTPDAYGARLGNNENVVVALALRPFARLSPEAAGAELNRIRSGPAYANGDPIAVAKARMLNLVVAGKTTEAQAPTVQPRAFGTRGGDPSFPTQGSEAARKLRAELNQLSKDLTDSRGELSRNPEKRKRAVARRQEINVQLEGQS